MNEQSPNGSLKRAVTLSVSAAALAAAGALSSAVAAPAIPSPAALLPQHVGGMLGFLGGRESNNDSKLKDVIREELADAGVSDVPLHPADGAFDEQVHTPPHGAQDSSHFLALLRQFAPQAGGWSSVPGTAFDGVRLPDTEATALGIRGTDGSRAVLTNNNGAAYDRESQVLYFWGGGGSSYGGNEVYRLNLETLQPEQIGAPSALTQPVEGAGGASCVVPSDGPAASSTYDGIVWSEVTQTLFVFPSDRFCPDTTVPAESVWEFNPSDGSWAAVAGLGSIQGPVAAEYEQATDKIWIVTPGTPAKLQSFDPLTGTVSEGDDLGIDLASAGNAVMRGTTGDLLLLAAEGVYEIPIASPATARRLGDVPAEIDPRAGLSFDAMTDRLVVWTGGQEIRTFDPSAAEWQTFTPPSGPEGEPGPVLSKWVSIPELSIFAGYHDPAEGLWLYRLPAKLPGGQPSNRAPIADAGTDASVPVRATYTLSGSNSVDPDHDSLTFAWQIVQKPPSSTATLGAVTASESSFVPDTVGQYVLRLTVSDGTLLDTDTVTLSAANTAPQANAGRDRYVSVGSSVVLDGTNSSDPNQDSLSYAWTLVSKPSGSTATLQNSASARPSVTHDVAGAFVIQLVVSDGIVNSAADTVRITAAAEGTPIGGSGNPGDLTELAGSLPAPGAWTLIPNTAFDLVRLSAQETEAAGVQGATGSRSVLLAWNGAAFDETENTLYFFGGGHADYGGNEVYSLDLRTIDLRRRTDPSPLTDRQSIPGTCAPQTGPAAPHTYGGFVWSAATGSAFQFSRMGYAPYGSDCPGWTDNWISEFNPNADSWSRVSPSNAEAVDDAVDQAISYPMCAESDKTGLIYCLSAAQQSPLYVYDPARREMVCRSNRTTDRYLMTGTGVYHDGYLYYSSSGINRIYVDDLNASNCEFAEDEVVAPMIPDISNGFGFQFRGDAIFAWNGNERVWKWALDESTFWTQLAPASASAPRLLYPGATAVYSKWVYLADLDVFAGYNNPEEGLWLYQPGNAAQIDDQLNAAKAALQAQGFQCSDDVGGWRCPSLQDAVDATPAGGTLTMTKGIYNQCAKIIKPIVLDGNGSHVKQASCDGKGTFLLTEEADNSTIKNVECSNSERCVRREVPSITLQNVYFHDSDYGFQGRKGTAWGVGTAGYVGTITIEDSVFRRLGKGGQAHAIYAEQVDQLIIRRSKFLCSKEGDHEIKTGARLTLIEDTTIDSEDCVDSRAIDAFNGGELIIRRSTLVEGVNSENRQIIGYNWERRAQFPVNRVEITDSAFVCNQTASIIRWGTPGPSSIVFNNNTLTGSCIDVP